MTEARPLIETERTIIRVPVPSDADELNEYNVANREHLAPWEPLHDEEYFTAGACSRLIEKLQSDFEAGVTLPLVAWSKEEKRIVARCNFSNIVRGSFRACHLGYSVDKAHQGKGIMFEVADAAIHHVFERLGLHRVMANYLPRNERSGRLLERLGFEREGYARSYLLIAGRWEDHILTARINPAEERAKPGSRKL